MSSLHTISKAPAAQLLDHCLAVLGKDDAILFIEDGVYTSLQGSELEKIPAGTAVYALREDMLARGILERRLRGVKAANTKKFVDLCCEFDKVISWF